MRSVIGALLLTIVGIDSAAAVACDQDATWPAAPGSLSFTAKGFALPAGIVPPGGFIPRGPAVASGPVGFGDCEVILNPNSQAGSRMVSWLEAKLPFPAGDITRGLRIAESSPASIGPFAGGGDGSPAELTFWSVTFVGPAGTDMGGSLSFTLLPRQRQVRIDQTINGVVDKSNVFRYLDQAPGIPCAEFTMSARVVNGVALWTVSLSCPQAGGVPQQATYAFVNQQHHTVYLGLLNQNAVDGVYRFQVFDL